MLCSMDAQYLRSSAIILQIFPCLAVLHESSGLTSSLSLVVRMILPALQPKEIQVGLACRECKCVINAGPIDQPNVLVTIVVSSTCSPCDSSLVILCDSPCAPHGDRSYERPSWRATYRQRCCVATFCRRASLLPITSMSPSAESRPQAAVYSATCAPQAWTNIDCAIRSSRGDVWVH